MQDRESNKTTTQDRYYTIGEVSTLCDVKQHVLRYWETQFTQLQKLTRLNGRRYYSKADVAFIRELKDLLYAQGFTISGAQKHIATKPEENAAQEVGAMSHSTIAAAIEDLHEAKQILNELNLD